LNLLTNHFFTYPTQKTRDDII